MSNTAGAPGFLRSRAARDLAALVGSAVAVVLLLLLAPHEASAAPLGPACALCDEDLASDPGARVLVVLPADGSVPAVASCLVDLGYVAFPLAEPVGAAG